MAKDKDNNPILVTGGTNAELAAALVAARQRAATISISQGSTSNAVSGVPQAFGPGTSISAAGGAYPAATLSQSPKKPRASRANNRHPTQELPPDVLKTKKVTYDQVRAIAMAPQDSIGGFGWAALGGLVASVPATVQDVWASYVSKHPVGLPPGRLVDIVVTVAFAVAFGISMIKRKEATSEELLNRLFPEDDASPKS